MNYEEISAADIKRNLKDKAHFFLIRLTIEADEDGIDDDYSLINSLDEYESFNFYGYFNRAKRFIKFNINNL